MADLLPCDIESPVRIGIADNLRVQILAESKEEKFHERIFGELGIYFYNAKDLIAPSLDEIFDKVSAELIPPAPGK